MMSGIVRFGVSLEKKLLERFDRYCRKKNYANRSDAIRGLIRRELVDEQWQESGEVAGAVTLVYDHHRRALVNKLMNIQHDFQDIIISTQHVHLDHDNCLEIVAVKGDPRKVKQLADSLRATRGVKHGTLSMSTTGRGLE
jgi:CopG family nickel-responsive transcriptional regulator